MTDQKSNLDHIRNLEAAARELEKIRRSCDHTWGTYSYDPEPSVRQVPNGKLIVQGSDVWVDGDWEPCSLPRWSATCTKCGAKTYKYKMP